MYAQVLNDVEILKAILIACATSGSVDGIVDQKTEYKKLRRSLMKTPTVHKRLPKFVIDSRELSEFWSFIKPKFPTYRERREYLVAEFAPLLEELEIVDSVAADDELTAHLGRFSHESIQEIWKKGLERRHKDVEGAITLARTLLESTTKHILDDLNVEYDDGEDLPKLYYQMSTQLRLAPSQHTEQIYKQILGGCKSVVEGIGSIRNKLGDAHGKGKNPPKPSARHAELSINLAGAMAAFCLQTHHELKTKAALKG